MYMNGHIIYKYFCMRGIYYQICQKPDEKKKVVFRIFVFGFSVSCQITRLSATKGHNLHSF